MVPVNSKPLFESVESYPFNPLLIQREVLNALEAALEGKLETIDPTNPFGFLMEASCVLTSGFISKDYDLNRRQYAASAQTEEDLYYHMSDKDFLDRFALPAKEKFVLMLSEDEVRLAMSEDPELGIRKLVIPRDTNITVGEVTFCLEYPIEIRELSHGGLQIIRDLSIESPITQLESNLVDWEIVTSWDGEREYTHIRMELPAKQVKIKTLTRGVTLAAPVSIDLAIDDYYHFARVFYQDDKGDWVEMQTTHNPNVYNIDVPTAVLKVTSDNLNVSIPLIYCRQGLVDSQVRVDLYETKGELAMELGGYNLTEFTVDFVAIDKKRDETIFTAPVPRLGTVICFSTGLTTGGRNPLSFEELKRRVKLNTYGPQNIPISNVEIESRLQDEGFTIVKNVDLITNRIYYASRSLPLPTNDKLITAAAASIETLITSVDDLVATGNVRDNGESVTILPGTIYESKNGVLNVINESAKEKFLKLPLENRAVEVNKRHLYYTPFHYVMDLRNNRFDLRTYYLDKPNISSKTFDDFNNSTLLQITIDSYTIERTVNGYKVSIVTSSDENIKALTRHQVGCVMMFKSKGEVEYAYLKGQLTGISPETGERFFDFNIETNYNVNEDDDLILTSFKMHNEDYREIPIKLEEDLKIVFYTTEMNAPGWTLHEMDDDLPRFLVPDEAKAIISETLRIRFGYPLNSLWKQARSVVSTEVYETYPADVLGVYQNDVLDRDPVTGSGVRMENGRAVLKYLHRKGDPIRGADGRQVVVHRKGDIVRDDQGRPIVARPRALARQLDLMLIEAAYWFATDTIATDYQKEIIQIYLDWMIDGLGSINERVLEQTKIYFYPRATLGLINVMYDNGIKSKIHAAQSLLVDLVVNKNVYANEDLKENIRISTIRVVNNLLNAGTISTSGIMSQLTKEYGDDVIGIKLSGLGGDKNIIAMSVLDDNKRCSLKKRLVVQSDNTLMVEEDVTVNFIKHDVSSVI